MRTERFPLRSLLVALITATFWSGCISTTSVPAGEIPPSSTQVFEMTPEVSFVVNMSAGSSWVAIPFHISDEEQAAHDGYFLSFQFDGESNGLRAILIASLNDDNFTEEFFLVGSFIEQAGVYSSKTGNDFVMIAATENASQSSFLRLGLLRDWDHPDFGPPKHIAAPFSGAGARISYYVEEESISGAGQAPSSHGVAVENDRRAVLPTSDALTVGGQLRVLAEHSLGQLGFHYAELWVGNSGAGARGGELELRASFDGAHYGKKVPYAEQSVNGARGSFAQGIGVNGTFELILDSLADTGPITSIHSLSVAWDPREAGARVEPGVYGLRDPLERVPPLSVGKR